MDTEALRQQLEAEIEEIKETLEEAESSGYQLNEATTESTAIDPLLKILGYNSLQRRKRDHDSVANNFPDYTLLPDTPHRWFLEVKRLDLPLRDGEAAQAVNYANNQGAEWAILTNGRTWYIYNAHLPKPLPEKCVMQIADLFSDGDGVEKLLLLSRESMQNGGLTHAWPHQRIAAMVRRELETPASPIREHLCKIGSKEIGVELDDAAIGKAIASCGINQVDQSSKTAQPYPPPQPSFVTDTVAASGTFYTFRELAENKALATGRKPNTLKFLDGHDKKVSDWTDVVQEVVEWACHSYSLPPLPFMTGLKGKSTFINSTPNHGDGKKMEQKIDTKVGARTLYVHVKTTTRDKAASITELLRAVGAPLDAVQVSIRG